MASEYCISTCGSCSGKGANQHNTTGIQINIHGANQSDDFAKINSYSDLFLDTASVTNFIASENANAGVAEDIRSFYNLRNFQFAWFASDGLTEQARSFWNLASFKKDTSLANKSLSKKLRFLLPNCQFVLSIAI